MNHSCPEYIGKQNTGYHQRFTWRKGITGTVHVLTLPKGILQRRQPGNKHSIGPFLKAVKTSRNNFTLKRFHCRNPFSEAWNVNVTVGYRSQRTVDANKQQDIQWDLRRHRNDVHTAMTAKQADPMVTTTITMAMAGPRRDTERR